MTGMSSLSILIMVWSFSFCYAVQIFAKGAHGLVTWTDAPNWRDRSVVPTPPPQDVAAYKKRGKIPNPYPKMVNHVYVGPVSSEGKKRKHKNKKNVIQRIFFSLPVGAELPIYYTHQKSGSHKKSKVASHVSEGARFFSEDNKHPFRTSTWGLQQQVGNEDISPELESRTIARQNLIPSEGEVMNHGITSQYLRPRTVERYRVLQNSGQFFKRPSRTERILNVYRRSRKPQSRSARSVTKTKKTTLLKNSKGANKVAKAEVKKASDAKKSGLPKGSKRNTSRGSRKINTEIENILTKFLIVL